MSDLLNVINDVKSLKYLTKEEACALLYYPGVKLNISQSPNATGCTPGLHLSDVYTYSNCVTALMCLFLSFIFTRKFLCLKCCWGRPGIVYPMNTLEMRHTTVLYCLAFAVMSNLVHSIIVSSEGSRNPLGIESDEMAIRLMLKLLAVLIYGGTMYPLFACISVGSAVSYLVGSIFIWMYTIIIFIGLFHVENCSLTATQYLLIVTRNILYLVCMVLLCIYMPYYSFIQFKLGQYFKPHFKKDTSYLDYTKQVISRTVQNTSLSHKLKGVVRNVKQKKFGSFRYPPAFLSSLCVSFVVVYMTLYVSMTKAMNELDPLLSFLDNCIGKYDPRTIRDVWNDFLYPPPNRTKLEELEHLGWNIGRLSEFYLYVFKVCWIVGECLPMVIFLIQVPFILLAYKRHMKSLYKGNFTEILPQEKAGSPASIVCAYTKHTGYMVAYLCWAYIIQTAILVFVFFGVACILIIPLVYNYGQFWLELLQYYWPIPVFSLLINYVQLLVIKFGFLPDKGKYLYITNRRVFFLWSYFIFIYNVFLGFFSCLLRLILNAGLGILFIGRLDFSLMSSKFEKLDGGYKSYLGYLHVHNAHSNPHLLTFIHILKEQAATTRRHRSASDVNSTSCSVNIQDNEYPMHEEVTPHPANNNVAVYPTVKLNSFANLDNKKRAARFNWLLFYTLMRNPGLQVHRKHQVDAFNDRLRRLNESQKNEARL